MHRYQMGLKYMLAYLRSLIHEVRHYRKCPDKMRCKQFPRYLWNVETMPRNLRLSRYFKLLNVKDCPVKLLSYAYIQWVWCSPRCKQSNVGQLSRDRLVQGCFYLANTTQCCSCRPAFPKIPLPHLHSYTVKSRSFRREAFFSTTRFR